MLTVLYGPDSTRIKTRIGRYSQEVGKSPVFFTQDNPPTSVSELVLPDLFSGTGLFVLKGLLKELLTEENLETWVNSQNQIIFWEESLDGRTTLTATLKKHQQAHLEDYALPEYSGLLGFVKDLAIQEGVEIGQAAIKELIFRLGYLPDPNMSTKIDPGRIRQELLKLQTSALKSEVTVDMVKGLVPQEAASAGFAVSNALADRDARKLLAALDGYYGVRAEKDTADKTLALTALLAEQFRSMWAYLQSRTDGVTDDELMQVLGWKSGKLYAVKRSAQRFSLKEVESILEKLEHLDVELKTTTTPSRVIMELILSQV